VRRHTTDYPGYMAQTYLRLFVVSRGEPSEGRMLKVELVAYGVNVIEQFI